jgi:hypothetical protein
MTFVSLTVGSVSFETKLKAVKSKQQIIEFGEDFDCVISDECLTIRTPPEDGSPTSTALPVIVKLHRKGLIDSDVIASGKILLPLESTAIDNISVGLFQVDDERAEIAIAKLSVEIKLAKTNDGGLIGAVVQELEHLMLEYSRGRVGSGTNVNESLQRFFTTVTPLRRFVEQCFDLLTWRRSYVSSWLFLLTVTLFPPIGIFAAFLVVFCVAFQIPLPLLRFIPSSTFERPKGGPETPEQSVEKNVLFLAHMLERSVKLSKLMAGWSSSLHFVVIFLSLYLVPLHFLIVAVMAYHTFLAEALLRVLSSRFRFIPQPAMLHHSEAQEGELIVIENQRWWFGKWSDRLIGDEGHPWTDLEGNLITAKESIHPPDGTEWSSKWLVADSTDQEHGWAYGRDFDSLTDSDRELADFVRSRRWVRRYKPRNRKA